MKKMKVYAFNIEECFKQYYKKLEEQYQITFIDKQLTIESIKDIPF